MQPHPVEHADDEEILEAPGFWRKHRFTLIRDLGLIIIAFALAAIFDYRLADRQERLENIRADRQEALENTRFVREAVMTPGGQKPFAYLMLAGAQLSLLDFSCGQFVQEGEPTTCADFRGANLSGANLHYSDLTGANLYRVNLSGADLGEANIREASFSETNLRAADLSSTNLGEQWMFEVDLSAANLKGSNLFDADLSRASMTGTILEDVCYGEGTKWPAGFAPPPSSTATAVRRVVRG